MLEGIELRSACWKRGAAVHPINQEQALKFREEKTGLLWIDIIATDPKLAFSTLTEAFSLHPLAVEDALSKNERPGFQEYDNQVFVTLSTIVQKDDEESYPELACFLGPHYFITISTERVDCVDRWFERWTRDPKRVGDCSAMLFHAVVDEAIDAYFPAVDVIETEVDKLEDKVFQNEPVDTQDALRIKHRLLELRRQITPTRDILNGLLRRGVTVIPDSSRVYLQDAYDHTLRVIENAELNREVLADLMDAQLSVISNKLNLVMQFMAAISIMISSAALLTGVYGMNFDHIPFLHTPGAFEWFMCIMGGVVVLEASFFWYLGWLKPMKPFR